MERSRFCQGWRGGLRHPKGLALTGSAARRRLAQPGRKDALYLTRRGLAAFRRGGVCGGSCPCILPSNGLAASQSRNGSPAWRTAGLATQHPLRCADMQAIAALPASWGERVFELAPHLQCTPRANRELSPGTSRRRFPACVVPATDPHQRARGPRAASAGSCFRAIRSGAGALPGVPARASQGQPPPPGEPPRPPGWAALTGPPRAALTGCAASRAQRRWRRPTGAAAGAAQHALCISSPPAGARRQVG